MRVYILFYAKTVTNITKSRKNFIIIIIIIIIIISLSEDVDLTF